MVVLGITPAMSGGDLLAADSGSSTHVHADPFGSTAYESAQPATATLPPRTSPVPSQNSTNNVLRVVFRRFSFVLFAGVLALASMGSRRLFGRR